MSVNSRQLSQDDGIPSWKWYAASSPSQRMIYGCQIQTALVQLLVRNCPCQSWPGDPPPQLYHNQQVHTATSNKACLPVWLHGRELGDSDWAFKGRHLPKVQYVTCHNECSWFNERKTTSPCTHGFATYVKQFFLVMTNDAVLLLGNIRE